jgi:hypothetical protein
MTWAVIPPVSPPITGLPFHMAPVTVRPQPLANGLLHYDRTRPMIADDSDQFGPHSLDVVGVEGVYDAQPLTKNTVLRMPCYPARKVVRVQFLSRGMPRVITVG